MALLINNGDYVYQTDWAGISQASDSTGMVVKGGSVTVSGTNSLVLAIGSGVYWAGDTGDFKSGTSYVTVPTAGSFDRIDIVTGSANGNFYLIQGTQSANPSPPTMSANNALLAFVNVGSNVTSISNTSLQDKRLTPIPSLFRRMSVATGSPVWIESGTADTAVVSLQLPNIGELVKIYSFFTRATGAPDSFTAKVALRDSVSPDVNIGSIQGAGFINVFAESTVFCGPFVNGAISGRHDVMLHYCGAGATNGVVSGARTGDYSTFSSGGSVVMVANSPAAAGSFACYAWMVAEELVPRLYV